MNVLILNFIIGLFTFSKTQPKAIFFLRLTKTMVPGGNKQDEVYVRVWLILEETIIL